MSTKWMVAGWLVTLVFIGALIQQMRTLNQNFEQLTKDLEEHVIVEVAQYNGQAATANPLDREIQRKLELSGSRNQSDPDGSNASGQTLGATQTRNSSTTSAPYIDKAPPPPATSLAELGITNVDEDLNLVALNGGAELGLKKAMKFDVTRNGEVIGAIRAMSVKSDHVIAEILSLKKGFTLRTADRVSRKEI